MALMAWVVPNGPADAPVGAVAALTAEEAAS